jgi:50S ribosomal protein L16 3-hydroxylase
MPRPPSLPLALLGGITPERFLADYWHKRPLMIRQAIPGFGGDLTPAAMQTLATRDEVESRLIEGRDQTWQLHDGPFKKSDFKRLPETDWTLLVQSVDHWLPAAAALLQHFDFLPHARLDDVMVSYAVPGGSVGPHFDSYDVFLLQGLGTRRWQISAQTELGLIDDAPLKLLRRFTPEDEWVLAPGDMLYLPPNYAHHGEATSACMTWSIGFRAPTAQELAQAFLAFLADEIELDGRYADPDLKRPAHPGELAPAMLKQIGAMLRRVTWDADTVADFVGEYLSEPKPNVYFEPPDAPLSAAQFKRAVQKHGVVLSPKTRLLFCDERFFVNGETVIAEDGEREALVELADRRALEIVPAGLVHALYDWYEAGWLVPGAGGVT